MNPTQIILHFGKTFALDSCFEAKEGTTVMPAARGGEGRGERGGTPGQALGYLPPPPCPRQDGLRHGQYAIPLAYVSVSTCVLCLLGGSGASM